MATTNKRKLHSADFKAKVALEAVRGLMTINEVGQKLEEHPMMVRQWKKAFLENAGACLITSAVLSLPITATRMCSMARLGA